MLRPDACVALLATLRAHAPDPTRAMRPDLIRRLSPAMVAAERARYHDAFARRPGGMVAGLAARQHPQWPDGLYMLMAQITDPSGLLHDLSCAFAIVAERLGPLPRAQAEALALAMQHLLAAATRCAVGAPPPAGHEAHAPLVYAYLSATGSSPALSRLLARLADHAAHIVAYGGDGNIVAIYADAAARMARALPASDRDGPPADLDDLSPFVGLSDDDARRLVRGRVQRFGPRRVGEPDATSPRAGRRRPAAPPHSDHRRAELIAAGRDLLARGRHTRRPGWVRGDPHPPTDPPLATDACRARADRRKGSSGTAPTGRLAQVVREDGYGCLAYHALPQIVAWLVSAGQAPSDASLTQLSRATALLLSLFLMLPMPRLLAARAGTAAEAGQGRSLYDEADGVYYLPDPRLGNSLARGDRHNPRLHMPWQPIMRVRIPAPLNALVTLCLARARAAGGNPEESLFWVSDVNDPPLVRALSAADLRQACAVWSRYLFAPVAPSHFRRAGEALALLPQSPVPPMALPLISGEAGRWANAVAYLATWPDVIDSWADDLYDHVLARVMERLRRLGCRAEDLARVDRWLGRGDALNPPDAPPRSAVVGSPHRASVSVLAAWYRAADVAVRAARGDPHALADTYRRLVAVEMHLYIAPRLQDIPFARRRHIVVLEQHRDHDGQLVPRRYGLLLQGKSDATWTTRPRVVPLPLRMTPTVRRYRALVTDDDDRLVPPDWATTSGLDHLDACRHALASLTAERARDRPAGRGHPPPAVCADPRHRRLAVHGRGRRPAGQGRRDGRRGGGPVGAPDAGRGRGEAAMTMSELHPDHPHSRIEHGSRASRSASRRRSGAGLSAAGRSSSPTGCDPIATCRPPTGGAPRSRTSCIAPRARSAIAASGGSGRLSCAWSACCSPRDWPRSARGRAGGRRGTCIRAMRI